jgi:hypothetical protein
MLSKKNYKTLMMSAEQVRELGAEELCKWLEEHPDLHPSHRALAVQVVKRENIVGTNFLELTIDEWVKVVGLGTAKSLVQIAQRVLENEEKTPESKLKHLD